MGSDKEHDVSPRRSRSQHESRKTHRRRRSRETSPNQKRGQRSSSSSHRSRKSSGSPSSSEKHKRKSHNSRIKKGKRSHTPASTDSRDREDPNVCHCLGVFGLSSCTQEKDLKEVFGQYGQIDDICIIYDRQSGHSKGYGFVYFRSTSDAVQARKSTQGLVLDRRPIRVDYSLTLRPHSPTPGRYLGRRTSRDFDKFYNDSEEYDSRCYVRDSYSRSSNRHYHDYDDNYHNDYEEGYNSRRSRRYSPYSR